jgi:rhamnosyltransferase
MGARPRCAVVISASDAAQGLGDCLRALLADPPARCEMRVLVVDDGGDRGALASLGFAEDRVELVAGPRQPGLAAARNAGAAASAGADYLVFLAAAATPAPGWLDALVAEAEARPPVAVAAVGLLARRTAFEAAGGFDATVPDDFAPIDLCLRLGEGEAGLARLLSIRTRQVMELQAERTRALLGTAPLAPSVSAGGTADGARPPAAGRLLRRGEFRRLGSGPARHRVSILMPVKDAAADLRRSLPEVLRQRVAAELEIVAVDSGSSDDTVEVLAEFGATVIAIDPSDFDHGLTRNLAAEHAGGDVLVFLNARALPCDERWLAPLLSALDADPAVAGACSRVLPHPGADLLARRDVELDPSGSDRRAVKRIDDWRAYREMPVDQRRLLLNFHTVAAAIRADALRQIPFRSVRAIGEDLLWSRQALEAGMTLVHEPGSRVFHSHDYSLRELFMRNVDDGIANREINDRTFSEPQLEAFARATIAADWRYLREELGLTGDELERWQISAALRRVAQGAGQWLGASYAELPADAVTPFSGVGRARERP